jgi:hypothetical protein
MSKISGKKRYQFENPSNTLEEVFLFLCRNLANAKLSFDNLTYTLQQDSLRITFQLESIWGKSKTEFLTIETLWNKGELERYHLKAEYEDLKDYFFEEVFGYTSLFSKEAANSIINIKTIRNTNNLPAYKDSFGMDLAGHVFDLNRNELTYETTSINRGLMTLTHVKSDLKTDNNSFIWPIMHDMIHSEDVKLFLERRFSKDLEHKEILRFLRKSKIPIQQPFHYSLEQKRRPIWENKQKTLLEICENNLMNSISK